MTKVFLRHLVFLNLIFTSPILSQEKLTEFSVEYGETSNYDLRPSIKANQNNQIHFSTLNFNWSKHKRLTKHSPFYRGFNLSTFYKHYQNSRIEFSHLDYLSFRYGYITKTPTYTSILTEMQQVNLSTGFGVYYGKLSPFIPTKKHSFHGGLSFSLSTPIYLRQSFKHINESNFQYNLSNLNYLNYIDLQLKASFRYLYKINPKNYLGLLLSTTGILSNLNQASYLGTFSIGISYIYL